ncbi:MAG: peptide ABC transporter substrate-binding protein [Chloroflexota bacterium]
MSLKNLFVLLVVSSMLVGLLAACGETATPTITPTTAAATTVASTTAAIALTTTAVAPTTTVATTVAPTTAAATTVATTTNGLRVTNSRTPTITTTVAGTITPTTKAVVAITPTTRAVVSTITPTTTVLVATTITTTALVTPTTTAYKPINLKHAITGGTFNWSQPSEPLSLDPAIATDDTSLQVIWNLYDGLLELLPDLTVGPSIAEKMPTLSPDGLTYTFILRKDVKFSNGDPVSSKDFVYSWRRVLSNPEAEYSFVFDNVKGVSSKDGLNDLRNIALNEKEPNKKKEAQAAVDKAVDNILTSSIKAVDDYTISITLEEPAAYFLTAIALWPWDVVNKNVIDKYGDKWTEAGNLTGTGPFILKEWNHTQNMKLVYNPNYFQGRAGIDGVNIVYIKEDATARLKYDRGELDDIRVAVTDIQRTAKDTKLKDQFHKVPMSRTTWLGFNMKNGIFATNLKLRQAFFAAIDRQLLTDKMTQGSAAPTTVLLPEGIPGYKKYDGYPFDPAIAKQYLKEAGFDTPEKIKQLEDQINNFGDASNAGGIAFNTDQTVNKSVWENVQQQLHDNLGLNLKLNPVTTFKEFRVRRDTNHEFLLFRSSWGANYPDAQNFYQSLFGCSQVENSALYCNDKYDAAWKKGNIASSQSARDEAYQEAEKILSDDAAYVPLFNPIIVQLTKPYIQNWGYNPQNIIYFKYMEIKKP